MVLMKDDLFFSHTNLDFNAEINQNYSYSSRGVHLRYYTTLVNHVLYKLFPNDATQSHEDHGTYEYAFSVMN